MRCPNCQSEVVGNSCEYNKKVVDCIVSVLYRLDKIDEESRQIRELVISQMPAK